MKIEFTAYCKAQPQGSMKAFVIGGKARLTSDNTKLKPFRDELTRCAIEAVSKGPQDPLLFVNHVPVRLRLEFVFLKPPSAPRGRLRPVVKPDIDKLCRSTSDALTSVLYHDDAQVVELIARKSYGEVECVHVTVEEL